MQRIQRRNLLLGSVAGIGLPYLLPSRLWAASSSEKLRIAVIGVAGRGRQNLDGVSGEQIAALCDVDSENLKAAAARFPAAKCYRDFRKLFDEMHSQIDAVVVSTPDHTHAPAGAAALRLGKHLYCEKPMAHEVFEVRTLTELAARGKLITQLGTQIHSEKNYRRVVELIRAGAIGPVGEVHVWAAAKYSEGDRPKDTPPVPPNLDWDLWLGPAPHRPYHPAYVPARWRSWWDFGTGALGDFYCHYSDLAFWALDLKYPTAVEAEGPPPHPEGCPQWLIVRYEFPARGDAPPVKLTWYDSGRRPPLLEELGQKGWSSGVLFVGRDGYLLSDYTRHKLLPEEKFRDYQRPAPSIPDSPGHHREWIEGCKTGKAASCDFAYSGPLTEAALLGAAAYRSGERFTWNAAELRTVNADKAQRYIRREYRPGWTL